MAEELTKSQCTLLAIEYASESDIKSLHKLAATHTDELDPELVLRILLTFLPEVVEPALYTTLVDEVTSHVWLEQQDTELDISSVKDLSDAVVQKRLRKNKLLELIPATFPPHAPNDILSRFLCHRAQRIDTETGLLRFIPELLKPFLHKSEYVKIWFVAVVLPLLRMQYEYYPSETTDVDLKAFENFEAAQGIEFLLAKATHQEHEITSATESEGTIGRDLRGLVGPWMYGHTERKRRKLNREAVDKPRTHADGRRISLSGATEEAEHDWEFAYQWLVRKAVNAFPMVTNAVEEWDGPSDIDLGDYAREHGYLDEDLQSKLEKRYAQCAFASCYAVEANSSEVIDGAHGILVRLAGLLDFEPPPDLATSVEQLPRIDSHASLLHRSQSTALLEPAQLMMPDHPLTSPTLPTFMLLQMLVYSAYQLAGLGHAISIVNVTKLRFYSEEEEQRTLLKKVLHGLAANGKRDDQQWTSDRGRFLWLWNWNIDEDGDHRGAGPLGDIRRDLLEKEILKAMLITGNYSLVEKLYIQQQAMRLRLSDHDLEQVILGEAMKCYDNASNGNRSRGSMKKASDIVTTFRSSFPKSKAFEQASALIAGTHSLSFYSLTLQHGVPFQPVNIRASQDPLSLLPKVLEQNPQSYTKLDDLISIGRNLSSAAPLQQSLSHQEPSTSSSSYDENSSPETAEQRVIYMCIESALTNSDFDTAYSYLINRLAPDPSTTDPQSKASTKDDTSWRAAYLAGRYRPRDTAHTPPLHSQIRRLEQRTELLSLSLLLAPTTALTDILAVYRRTEEELHSLLAQQTAEEQDFEDRARTQSSGFRASGANGIASAGLPGVWIEPGSEGRVFGQERREVGRLYNNNTSSANNSTASFPSTRTMQTRKARDEEAPVGLFDLAQGAARAFGRNAFPLRGGAAPAASTASGARTKNVPVESGEEAEDDDGGDAWGWGGDEAAENEGDHEFEDENKAHTEAGGRVRRRDMVANAASGALASGLGWVLGATPVNEHQSGGGRH